MKLARYGERGAEKPALVDGDGKLRDLSGHVADIAGDVLTDLETLKALDPASLPLVEAFEKLASEFAELGPRHSVTFGGLIHPVHQQGTVYGWTI